MFDEALGRLQAVGNSAAVILPILLLGILISASAPFLSVASAPRRCARSRPDRRPSWGAPAWAWSLASGATLRAGAKDGRPRAYRPTATLAGHARRGTTPGRGAAVTSRLRGWLEALGDVFWIRPALIVLGGVLLGEAMVLAEKAGTKLP